jgi:hypothetical protein
VPEPTSSTATETKPRAVPEITSTESIKTAITSQKTSDCDVVFSLWEGFGKQLDSKTECCSMTGITCSGDKVIKM